MKESYNGVSIEEIVKYGLLGEEVNFNLIYDN